MSMSDEKLIRLVAELQRAVIGVERNRLGLVQPQVRRPLPPRPGLSRA